MPADIFFRTDELSVGYAGKALISNINIELKKGEILTLIGPNGSGKSTILKSITKHLSIIKGTVFIENKSIKNIVSSNFAKKISVVLTDKIKPELMTCKDVVAMGRYPYTNYFGKLTPEDDKIIEESLEKVRAMDLANRDFLAISDGQRQRVMLARAICQKPEIIVLDEPTSYLDIRHKIELLEILRKMSREDNITVIMSLHEIDLAAKISDMVMCVKGDTISKYGKPSEIFKEDIINDLYSIGDCSYNMLFGSVELPKNKNEYSSVFVLAGGGYGIDFFRELQKMGISFDTGILYENDVDYQIAKCLANKIYSAKAFEKVENNIVEQVVSSLENYKVILDAKTPIGELNSFNSYILEKAREKGIKIVNNTNEV